MSIESGEAWLYSLSASANGAQQVGHVVECGDRSPLCMESPVEKVAASIVLLGLRFFCVKSHAICP